MVQRQKGCGRDLFYLSPSRSALRLFSLSRYTLGLTFFLKKIAEFAIILELNGYSDCMKIG